MELAIVGRGQNAVWGHIGPIACCAWNGDITVPDLASFAAYSDSLGKLHPDGIAILSFVALKMKPPKDEVKQKIVEMRNSALQTGLRVSVVILNADGFWASVMRSMLASFNLLGNAPNEKYVKNVDEAATEIATAFPGLDVAALADAMRRFAAEAGARS